MSSHSCFARHDPHRRVRMSVARVPALLTIATFVVGHAVGCATMFPDFRPGTPNAAPARLLASESVLRVEPGAHVRIWGDDGGFAEGEFLGVAEDSDSAYAVRFGAHRAELEAANIPALGETIRLAPRSFRRHGDVITGRFRGFDYLGVRVEQERGIVQRFAMSKVDSLWGEDGRGVSGWQLAHLDADHRLPSYTMLVVRQKSVGADGRFHTRRVETPWESARTVESPAAASSHGGEVVAVALVAGIVGAAIVIYAVSRSLDDASDGCSRAMGGMSAPGLTYSELRHVRRAEHDFDRVAGEFVESGPALATR